MPDKLADRYADLVRRDPLFADAVKAGGTAIDLMDGKVVPGEEILILFGPKLLPRVLRSGRLACAHLDDRDISSYFRIDYKYKLAPPPSNFPGVSPILTMQVWLQAEAPALAQKWQAWRAHRMLRDDAQDP